MHFSTGGILFLVGAFPIPFIIITWDKVADEKGYPLRTDVPFWPG